MSAALAAPIVVGDRVLRTHGELDAWLAARVAKPTEPAAGEAAGS